MLTQAGEVRLARVYFQCVRCRTGGFVVDERPGGEDGGLYVGCRTGGFVVDERLGIAGRSSPQAQRLICLAGGSWSYDLASRRLAEFCGLSVSDTTIRELSQQHGALANQWLREEPAAARHILLREGWQGIEGFLKAEGASRTPTERAELDALRNYLAPHQLHLNYAERLREGRSIGSGQIEGACKNLIGRRLKAHAARWPGTLWVRRVNRMAGLCCLLDSDQWDAYWKSA